MNLYSSTGELHRNRVGENGPWDQVPQINTESNITSYQVTDLIPFTVYSFRLRAVNKLGISPPSKESYYIVSLREGKKRLKLSFIIHVIYTCCVTYIGACTSIYVRIALDFRIIQFEFQFSIFIHIWILFPFLFISLLLRSIASVLFWFAHKSTYY